MVHADEGCGVVRVNGRPASSNPRKTDPLLADRIQRAVGRYYHPDIPSWEALSPEIRESCREQAEDIITKIALIGCSIRPLNIRPDLPFAFTPRELETLSIQEHDRWLEEKTRQGWVFGPLRDDLRRIHPCIVPWDRLPERERAKDAKRVNRIPAILELAGLAVVR